MAGKLPKLQNLQHSNYWRLKKTALLLIEKDGLDYHYKEHQKVVTRSLYKSFIYEHGTNIGYKPITNIITITMLHGCKRIPW